MTPCSHPAALRFLRLAVPQRSLVSFAPWWTSAPPGPGVGSPVSPAGNSLRSEQGSPKFLGNHDCPFAMFQTDAGRTVCTKPYGATAWPLVIEGQRLPRKVFRRSIALLSDSLSTLRSADYSHTTQDSLPVAGQALLDGLSTRRVPLKGFKVVDYISFPFPKLLGAIDVTEAVTGPSQLATSVQLFATIHSTMPEAWRPSRRKLQGQAFLSKPNQVTRQRDPLPEHSLAGFDCQVR